MCICRAKDLIRHLLDVHPAQRLTATQALQHPWCMDAMAGDELTDLSLTRAKLRKKDEHHRFKASRTQWWLQAPVVVPKGLLAPAETKSLKRARPIELEVRLRPLESRFHQLCFGSGLSFMAALC